MVVKLSFLLRLIKTLNNSKKVIKFQIPSFLNFQSFSMFNLIMRRLNLISHKITSCIVRRKKPKTLVEIITKYGVLINVSMNKIALGTRVCAHDWTAGRAIIASTV